MTAVEDNIVATYIGVVFGLICVLLIVCLVVLVAVLIIRSIRFTPLMIVNFFLQKMTAVEDNIVATYIGVVFGLICVLFILCLVVLVAVLIIRSIRFTPLRSDPDNSERHGEIEIPELLRSNAQRLGLKIHRVEGNDIYLAIADQLLQSNPNGVYTSEIVRNRVKPDIQAEKTCYSSVQPGKWDGKIASLDSMSGWEKDILLLHAAANAFRRNIEVIHGDRMESSVIRPLRIVSDRSTQNLYVGYCGSGRYVSLRHQNRQRTGPAEESNADNVEETKEETSIARASHEGRSIERHNILVGDDSHQFIVHSPSGDDSEQIATRNIVIGNGNTQNVLATFRTSNELLEYLRTMQQIEAANSQPMLRLKIRQRSTDISEEDIEESERRLIELLEEEGSEAREEMDRVLENFGFSFVSASMECILLHLSPNSCQSLNEFVRQFQNGDISCIISFLIGKQYRSVPKVLEIDVQLQMTVTVSLYEHNQILNHIKQTYKYRKQTYQKRLSRGLSVVIRKTDTDGKGFDKRVIPRSVTETLLKHFDRTLPIGRNHQVDVRFEQFCATEKERGGAYRHEVLQNASNMILEYLTGCVGIVQSTSGRRGTCFRIGKKYVMTAWHVVNEMLKSDSDKAFVKFPDTGETCHTNVSYIHKDLDVAILEVLNAKSQPKTLAQIADCYPGLPIYIAGYLAYCNEKEVERSVIVSTAHLKQMLPYRMVLFESAKCDRGSSGGPCVALIDGQVRVATMILGSVETATDVLCVGVRMTDVYNQLEKDNPYLARQIFHYTHGDMSSPKIKNAKKIFYLFAYLSVAFMYMSRKSVSLRQDFSMNEYKKMILSLYIVNREMQKVAEMLDQNTECKYKHRGTK